jgi:hypothetical protein
MNSTFEAFGHRRLEEKRMCVVHRHERCLPTTPAVPACNACYEACKHMMSIVRGASNPAFIQGMLVDHRGYKNGPEAFAATFELPWLNNVPFKSCIPHGEYLCRRKDSANFGDTFEILHVPGRTDVLFHWGSFIRNTLGCVLVGEEFDRLDGAPALLSSKKGFGEFLARRSGVDEFMLEIKTV